MMMMVKGWISGVSRLGFVGLARWTLGPCESRSFRHRRGLRDAVAID